MNLRYTHGCLLLVYPSYLWAFWLCVIAQGTKKLESMNAKLLILFWYDIKIASRGYYGKGIS